MEILFVSALASKATIDDIIKINPNFSGYAIQKFSRLAAEGFCKNGHYVRAFSTFYQPSFGRFWRPSDDSYDGV